MDKFRETQGHLIRNPKKEEINEDVEEEKEKELRYSLVIKDQEGNKDDLRETKKTEKEEIEEELKEAQEIYEETIEEIRKTKQKQSEQTKRQKLIAQNREKALEEIKMIEEDEIKKDLEEAQQIYDETMEEIRKEKEEKEKEMEIDETKARKDILRQKYRQLKEKFPKQMIRICKYKKENKDWIKLDITKETKNFQRQWKEFKQLMEQGKRLEEEEDKQDKKFTCVICKGNHNTDDCEQLRHHCTICGLNGHVSIGCMYAGAVNEGQNEIEKQGIQTTQTIYATKKEPRVKILGNMLHDLSIDYPTTLKGEKVTQFTKPEEMPEEYNRRLTKLRDLVGKEIDKQQDEGEWEELKKKEEKPALES